MTMRCADICHHTTPASKHKPPNPLSHVLCPTWSFHPSLHLFIISLVSFYLRYSSFYFILTPSSFPLFHLFLYSCSSSFPLPPTYLHSSISHLPSDSIHPSVHPCMHGWLSVRGSVCAISRATEPLWHSAVAQQPRRPGFRPRKCLFIKERGCETAHECISSFPLLGNL